jgi:hypothetical protein
MLAVPKEEGTNVKPQEAEPAIVPGTRVQLPDELKVPLTLPEAEKLAIPVGEIAVPDPVSVTVAVHVEAWYKTTGVSHEIDVVVVRAGNAVNFHESPTMLGIESRPPKNRT